MPRSFALYNENGHYNAAKMATAFKQQAAEMGRRFDERNETDFFAQTLTETPALKSLRAPFPLADTDA